MGTLPHSRHYQQHLEQTGLRTALQEFSPSLLEKLLVTIASLSMGEMKTKRPKVRKKINIPIPANKRGYIKPQTRQIG